MTKSTKCYDLTFVAQSCFIRSSIELVAFIFDLQTYPCIGLGIHFLEIDLLRETQADAADIRNVVERLPFLCSFNVYLPPVSATILHMLRIPTLTSFATNLPHSYISVFLSLNRTIAWLTLDDCNGLGLSCPLRSAYYCSMYMSSLISLKCPSKCLPLPQAVPNLARLHLTADSSLFASVTTAPDLVGFTRILELTLEFHKTDTPVDEIVRALPKSLRKLHLIEKKSPLVRPRVVAVQLDTHYLLD